MLTVVNHPEQESVRAGSVLCDKKRPTRLVGQFSMHDVRNYFFAAAALAGAMASFTTFAT